MKVTDTSREKAGAGLERGGVRGRASGQLWPTASGSEAAREPFWRRGEPSSRGEGGRLGSGERLGRIRLLGGVALLGGAACTLTQGDFEPVLTDPEPGAPAVADAGAAPASSASGGCSAESPCPEGFECGGGACVPLACSSEEGPACAAAPCLGGDCGADACADGALGAGEADVDCGGPCAPCVLGSACQVAGDCVSGLCREGRCVAPSCDDGLANQDESDADCGGACAPCGAGLSCASDADCESGLSCAPGPLVCSAPTCLDGQRNGAETDVDCGGDACPRCEDGAVCVQGADCSSGVCVDGSCAAASCTDGARNADETDVDCGGSCPACAPGGACASGVDCQSAVCGAEGCGEGVSLCCQAPACDDGVQNGGEPALDCGNAACGLCELGAACEDGAVCETNVCAGGACVSLCSDDRRNGDEGDVDCGGSEAGCPRCGDGAACLRGADCESGRCAAASCVSCDDGVQNGDEDGLDCGSSEPGCPACPRCDEGSSLDLGGPSTLTDLPGNACAMIASFAGYAPTVLESWGAGPYPLPLSWRQPCTGAAGEAVFTAQFQQVAIGVVGTACPVIFDLAGSSAPFAVRWY